jgi:ribonucleoside-diphosphate reductase alpha chain
MTNGIFLPNSPTIMNAGRKNGLLSACFVIPVPDSIDGIFTGVVCTARIQVAGEGTGFCFDQLRSTGDIVSSSGGRTSGPIAFMKMYGQVTESIQQGTSRRGGAHGYDGP